MLHNTRLKGVTMKFDATRDGAYVILEIDHRNEDQQEKLYNHFLEHRELLESAFDTPFQWDRNYTKDCGKQVIRIYKQLKKYSILAGVFFPITFAILIAGHAAGKKGK